MSREIVRVRIATCGRGMEHVLCYCRFYDDCGSCWMIQIVLVGRTHQSYLLFVSSSGAQSTSL